MKVFYSILFLFAFNPHFLKAQESGLFEFFEARAWGDFVKIQWKIAEGGQCFDTHVLRAEGEADFDTAYTLKGFCGGGTVYEYLDSMPSKYVVNHYRMQSGALEYSAIFSVDFRFLEKGQTWHLFPYPVTNQSTFVFSGEENQKYNVHFYDILGNEIKESEEIESNHFEINREEWERGVFFIRISDPKGILLSAKVIIQ